MKSMGKKHEKVEEININSSKRILIAGDLHGDTNRGASIIAAAKRENCESIIILGDFGYWEHDFEGVKSLRNLNKIAMRNNMIINFLDGNHDNHPLLWEKYCNTKSVKNEFNFFKVKENIFYIPRGNSWVNGNKKYVALGGAYSSDKQYRLDREAGKVKNMYGKFSKATGPNTYWWETEQITDQELLKAKNHSWADILLTHDGPTESNVTSSHNEEESLNHQKKISELFHHLKPEILLHGHFHQRVKTNINGKQIISLSHNEDVLEKQLIILT